MNVLFIGPLPEPMTGQSLACQVFIDELKKIGLDTARSVLEQDVDDLVKRTDLEEETILEVVRVLKEELED